MSTHLLHQTPLPVKLHIKLFQLTLHLKVQYLFILFIDFHNGFSQFGSVIGSIAAAVIVVIGVMIIYCIYKYKKGVRKKRVEDAEAVGIQNSTVLSSSCCHCSKLDQKLKDKGYNIKMLSEEQLNENIRTSLNGVPLITCECQVSCQLLESLPEVEKQNVVQLYTNTGNPLDDNGPAVDEVLNWLKTKSLRRCSITSEDGQALKLNEIHRDVKRIKDVLDEKTEDILEKQEQTHTTLSAICK